MEGGGRRCELFFVLGRMAAARDERGPRGFEAAACDAGAQPVALAEAVCRARASGRRLSVELIEAGALEAAALRSAFVAHGASVLARALELRAVRWRLETGLPSIPADVEIDLESSCAEVVSAATARIGPEALIDFHLGAEDRAVVLEADPAVHLQLGLSPLEGFVMSRVSGSSTLAEVLAQIGPGEPPRRALLALLCLGILRFPRGASRPEGGAEHEELRAELRRLLAAPSSDPFQVLSVSRSATPSELRRAWSRLARLLHPDRTRGPELDTLRPQIGAAFLRAAGAYEALSAALARGPDESGLAGRSRPQVPPPAARRSEPAPAPGDVTLPPTAAPGTSPAVLSRAPEGSLSSSASGSEPATPPPAADSAAAIEERFLEARRHYQDRRYWDALQIAEELLEQARGPLLRERLHLLRARCQAENPRWLHAAEQGLRAALHEYPQSAQVHYELARLYGRAGLSQRVSTELREALRCDPGHDRARAELEAIHGRPSSGMLRGLRRRLTPAAAVPVGG